MTFIGVFCFPTISVKVRGYDELGSIWIEAEKILRMITGQDYIGTVPNTVFPRYYQSLFPVDNKIIDFINLGFENFYKFIKNACWYPVEEVELV